jgi:signal peptidase I
LASRGDKAEGTKQRKRSPRHVKAAARILQKEARKILKRHRRRLAAEPAEAISACVAAIDTYRVKEDVEGLEEEAEKLDELLHQHASFARKSALRETIENIGIAVLIALGLRACFYEPFKIPSGSMMPTLRKGDHIFVNKFAYGVQIPFTSTVVGQSLGDIEHGDVVVFRYPLDPSEDFIKRVVGLPGDEVKVVGREVSVRHAGEDEFVTLPREPLDDKCFDDDGKHEVAGCELFRETHGENAYVVRYMATLDERDDFVPKARVWKVPEGHLLVMGDNRNQSHDSLQWMVRVQAVDADKILGEKDLRDLTSEKLFTAMRPDELGELSDPSHDHVTWMSTHRSRAHDIALALWREPRLGVRPMFDALAARVEGGHETTVADLVAGKDVPTGDELDRTLQVGATLDGLVVGRDEDGWHAVAYLEPAQAVLELHCGRKVCRNSGRLAARLTEVVARFERDREQATRELLVRPRNVRYGTHWTGRSDVRDHYFERALRREGGEGPRGEVRLQVFRKPKENIDVLQDAALRRVNAASTTRPTGAGGATLLPDLGERAWLVEGEQAFTFVATDDVRDMLVVLSCGRSRCKSSADAVALAGILQERVPKAASDRRKLKKMLLPEDLGEGWVEQEVAHLERNPFDRVRFEATVQGSDHSVELEAWHDPPEGLAAKVAALRTEYGMASSDAIAADGGAVEEEDGFHYAFGVAPSNTVIRIRCRVGLCASQEDAVKLARRAAEKAQNASTFIDPKAERPQPFVPRGNVKGRAERIWLPLSRFWKKIE